MSAPETSVEDGLGAVAALETRAVQDAPATPAEVCASRSSARRWLSALLLLPGFAVLLLVCVAASSSFHRAYDINGRVARLHVSAPVGAESAILQLDVDVEPPRRWSPHRVTLHSATCRVRVHGVDVMAHVPEIRYVGQSRISFPARVEAVPASDIELEPEPRCEVQSFLDLFGSGLVVPRTVYPSLDATEALYPAALKPKVWMERAASPTFGGTWNSSLSLEQAADVSVQVPAGSLPRLLHDVLDSAQISIEGAVTYSEEEDGSVRITKAVNSSLMTQRDGRGGYLLSLPVNVSGHILPMAFARTAAKVVSGRSRPRDEALPAEDGSVDRSVRLVADVPRSPMAQCLGMSHVVGWRSQPGSSVSELMGHARRQLGRRLAQSVVGSAGKHDFELPPTVRQGRRLGLMDNGKFTVRETMYFDTYSSDLELTAVIGEDSMDFAFNAGEHGVTTVSFQVDISDSEDAGSVVMDLTFEGHHLMTMDIANRDDQGTSVNARLTDFDGNPLIDVSATHAHDQDDRATVRLFHPDYRREREVATIEYFDATSEFGLDVAIKQPGLPRPAFTVAVKGTREGDLTTTEFGVALLDLFGDTDNLTLALNGSVEDDYGQVDGFSLDAVLVVYPSLQYTLGQLEDYLEAALDWPDCNDYIRRLSYGYYLHCGYIRRLSQVVAKRINGHGVAGDLVCPDGHLLRPVRQDECPDNPDLSFDCDQVGPGELCEADRGVCGTDNSLDNCGEGYDVYVKGDPLDYTTYTVTVVGTHAMESLQASALVESAALYGNFALVDVIALDPLVWTNRAEQFSIETRVLEGGDAILANFSLYLTNEPSGAGPQAIDIDSFDLELWFSSASVWRGEQPMPCYHGSCTLTAGLRDGVLDVNFEAKVQDFSFYTAALDAKAVDAEWSVAGDLSLLGYKRYWGHAILDNGGSSIVVDEFDFECAGGHMEDSRTMGSWLVVLDRDHRSFTMDGRFFDGNFSSDVELGIVVAVVETDTSFTSQGHVWYYDDEHTLMKWEGELARDEAASTETFFFTYRDAFGAWTVEEPLFNVTAVSVSDESTGTFTFTMEAGDQVGYLETFGSLLFQTIDFEQNSLVEASVFNRDNEATQRFSAEIEFTSVPPSRLLSDWHGDVHLYVTDPWDTSDVTFALSLMGTSSGGSFSSDLSIYGSGVDNESWSVAGTSSAERIDASGALSEDGSTVAIAFYKPGGMLDELGPVTTDITVEIGSPVLRFSMDYDGGMQFQASADVSDRGSHIFWGEATLHEQWVAVVSHSEFEQDVFEMGLNSVYEYFNMSIFAVETGDGVCEFWQDSYVKTYSSIETANLSVRYSADDGEVTDFSLLAYSLSKDRMTGAWAPTMNLSLRSGEVVATRRLEGSFALEVDPTVAADFAEDARVVTAIERVVAGRAGASIAEVDAALSLVGDQARRLSSAMRGRVAVSYAISVHITSEEGGEACGEQSVLDIQRALQDVTVEEFAADLNKELLTVGEDVARLYSVEPVSDSAMPPQVTLTATQTTTTATMTHHSDPSVSTAMPTVPGMSRTTSHGVGDVLDGQEPNDPDVSAAPPGAHVLAATLTGLLGAMAML